MENIISNNSLEKDIQLKEKQAILKQVFMYNDLFTISCFIDILLMFIYESHNLLFFCFGLLKRVTKDLKKYN